MKIITIGRSSNNDVIINDPLVSRAHCQIIQDDNGRFRLVDTNSRNGTFVNGTQRHREVLLNKTDIIRIGNTTLPWQSYFSSAKGTETGGGTEIGPGGGYYPPQPSISSSNHQPIEKPIPGGSEKPSPSALGVVALIVSLAGTFILVYCAVSIRQWGILGLISKSKLIIATAIISIIAFIIAKIAEKDDKADTKSAEIAEWLSGACVVVVVGFYLYLKFVDPNLLNPFN